jgi:hypothetical protein
MLHRYFIDTSSGDRHIVYALSPEEAAQCVATMRYDRYSFVVRESGHPGELGKFSTHSPRKSDGPIYTVRIGDKRFT